MQPNHTGHMAQIGLNMGARDARKFGYGTSFNHASLTNTDKTQQDGELIGALSIVWALLWAYMPGDMMNRVREKLNGEYPYPPMTTKYVPPGEC